MSLRANTALIAIQLLLPLMAYAQEPAAPEGTSQTENEPEVEYSYSARERVTIGVMEIMARQGVSQDTADTIADIIADHISKLGDLYVVSKADIISMLNLEKQKRLAGCTDKDCFSEIAGALGMPWMVTGNMGFVGESIILNLKLIDVRNAYVAGRATRRIKGDVDDLLDELPEATEELFEKVGDRFGFAMRANEVKSASKNRQSIFWSPSAITVLTREDIRSSGAATLSDLLRRVPGFDVYEAKYSYPLVGSRALTDESNNLVLVLVDGREILAEFTGTTFWSGLPVDLEDIERIEVIRGPGSTLYGANAFAAVLNITTMSDRPVAHAGFTVMGGEEGYYHLMGRAGDSWSLSGGTMSFGLSLGMDGKRSPSDPRDKLLGIYRAQGHLRYRRGRSLDMSLFAGVVPGGGLFFTHIGDMRITEALNYWLMGRAEIALGEITRLKAQLYLNSWQGNFHSRSSYSAYNIWIATPPDFFLYSPIVDGQVQLDLHLNEDLLLIGGANLRYVTLDCENYVPSSLLEFRGAVFVHAQWTLADMLQFTGGLRVDLSTEIEPAISPRAVVVFRPRPNHALRLGYGLAFRKPSLYESQVHPRFFDFNPATPEIVEKMTTSIGNEGLVNEKVHSFEAGWRARFSEDRLQISVDLFFNVYQDTISFVVDIQERMGLPDISNSTIQYDNEDGEIYAMGGEAEVAWHLDDNWSIWGNLGVRRVTAAESGDRVTSEPTLRANLGGRFAPADGLIADLALHYVSTYEPLLTDPENVFNEREPFPLGNDLLLIGRLGYRFPMGTDRSLEGGLTVRTPIGLPFREHPGVPIQRTPQSVTASDFGGGLLMRWVSFYLRGSF